MEINEIAIKLILHSGNARSNVMEALKCARYHHFDQAKELIIESDNELEKAHKVQTDVLQEEASGEEVHLSILFIHAQDHLMTAMLSRDLAQEMIDLRESHSKQ